MQQIRIFKALEYDVDRLEKEINDWLLQSRARVIQMTGNIAPQSESSSKGGSGGGSGTNPSDVIILILYEKI